VCRNMGSTQNKRVHGPQVCRRRRASPELTSGTPPNPPCCGPVAWWPRTAEPPALWPPRCRPARLFPSLGSLPASFAETGNLQAGRARMAHAPPCAPCTVPVRRPHAPAPCAHGPHARNRTSCTRPAGRPPLPGGDGTAPSAAAPAATALKATACHNLNVSPNIHLRCPWAVGYGLSHSDTCPRRSCGGGLLPLDRLHPLSSSLLSSLSSSLF
jgi:hypothetical protein